MSMTYKVVKAGYKHNLYFNPRLLFFFLSVMFVEKDHRVTHLSTSSGMIFSFLYILL